MKEICKSYRMYGLQLERRNNVKPVTCNKKDEEEIPHLIKLQGYIAHKKTLHIIYKIIL